MIEYFKYRKLLNSFQKTDLKDEEKIKLETFDKDVIKKLFNKSLEELSKEMLNNNINREYVLGYKHALGHLLSYFKIYK